jgi:hypothetical protein
MFTAATAVGATAANAAAACLVGFYRLTTQRRTVMMMDGPWTCLLVDQKDSKGKMG